MRQCLVCGQWFDTPLGRGRPPETCSPECAAKRKRQQREESRQRATERPCPEHLHGTSTGYTHFKCTCSKCRLWSRTYQQARRKAAAAYNEGVEV